MNPFMRVTARLLRQNKFGLRSKSQRVHRVIGAFELIAISDGRGEGEVVAMIVSWAEAYDDHVATDKLIERTAQQRCQRPCDSFDLNRRFRIACGVDQYPAIGG